ncbi:MAG: hypothetical protein MUP17_09425 [candidate division Zixibacteria bacterium]|nr:hypothetical protein [candidate division Zixibacteria bacterium]
MIPSEDKSKREKFKPRATKYSHCPNYNNSEELCPVFNWEIKRALARKQAVCDDRPTEKERANC